ncbi:MAG: hypothetical protein J0L60_13950 [Ignavibacteria bacterium]|nr:hypothetical protein [Ignavibacteria bacterium]
MKLFIPKAFFAVLLSLFVIACGGPADPVIVQAIKNDMIEEKKTTYAQNYDLSIELQMGAIYGSNGGMNLDQRIEKMKFLSSAKFKQDFMDWMVNNGYIIEKGERTSYEIRGSLTEKGLEYINSTQSVIKTNTGRKFCFYDQEINILEKKKNEDDSYTVRYSIRYVPIDAPHAKGIDLSSVDPSKLTGREHVAKLTKNNGIWVIKRFI